MQLNTILLTLSIICTIFTASANEMVIRNVTVISAERTQPLLHANVRIKDERIAEISITPLEASGSAIIVDGTGQYLIPGLMDSHVHVSSMPGIVSGDAASANKMAHLQSLYDQQQPRSYLYFGVTQLLDPSQSKSAISRFNANRQKPDLFHCGAVPILGGYPTMWADEQQINDLFAYLLDPKDPQRTPEAVVANMKKDGARCVKVFIEDGFGNSSDWPLISKALLQRLQAAAKQHGLKVMAHANAIDMQKIALDLGVDVIAHGMWNWNQYNNEPGVPLEITQILNGIMSKKITFQPTFNVMDGIKGVTVPGILNEPLYQKVIPAEIMAWYQTEQAQWFSREMIKDFGGQPLASIHQMQDRIISRGERVVSYLNAHDYPLVLASDTPSSPTYAAQPGYSTYAEMLHMAKAGVSLGNILAAATVHNAKAFGLADDYGTIEKGKVANLLLLTQNPLSTVEAYNSIDNVILHGTLIPRHSLAANVKDL